MKQFGSVESLAEQMAFRDQAQHGGAKDKEAAQIPRYVTENDKWRMMNEKWKMTSDSDMWKMTSGKWHSAIKDAAHCSDHMVNDEKKW